MNRGRGKRTFSHQQPHQLFTAADQRLVCFCRPGEWDQLEANEQRTIAERMTVLHDVQNIQPGDVVFPRFSRLPFGELLDEAVRGKNARLMNSATSYEWIADMANWLPRLEGVTPRTWKAEREPLTDGPYFVKGQTNSRKHQWDTHCYAKDRQQLQHVLARLQADPLMSSQQLYVREFVPLHQVGSGPQGLPISEEYRCFVADGELLSAGFYWDKHTTDDSFTPDPSTIPSSLITDVWNRVADRVDWVALDVARTQNGSWTIIELNEPSLAGLGAISPDRLYQNLQRRFQQRT